MDFALTETQVDLKAAARKYLSDRYPETRIAALADSAMVDTGAWPELVRQGWLDPDLEFIELALLAEEGGRALHPTPWWATVGLALPVYQAAGVALPGPATLADGSQTCRAVFDGTEDLLAGSSSGTAGWVLDGTASAVVDARAATEIVVAARAGSTGVALFGVPPYGAGVTVTERGVIDPLRGISDVELTRAPARPLVDCSRAASLLVSINRRAVTLLACEAVGVAERVLDTAVGYAKTRVQFDRPIGSYQAVAHQLAESYAEVELARSLAYRAAWVLQDRTKHCDQALACAVHASRRAAVQVCETAIQVCGGIGATWEFPLHRWYRRALWIDAVHAKWADPLDTVAGAILGG